MCVTFLKVRRKTTKRADKHVVVSRFSAKLDDTNLGLAAFVHLNQVTKIINHKDVITILGAKRVKSGQ